MKRFGSVSLLFLAIILVSLIFGALIVRDFGYSWDEYIDSREGEAARSQYVNSLPFIDTKDHDAEYPPFYFMVLNTGSDLLQTLHPKWLATDGRHLTNYSFFIFGLIGFFYLSRRYIRTMPALLATAFFGTQPLYFGHSFINQKDIPFMSLFVISVALGFHAADKLAIAFPNEQSERSERRGTLKSYFKVAKEDWRAMSAWKRAFLGLLSVILIALIIDLFIEAAILPLLQDYLTRAYLGSDSSLLTRAFQMVAQDYYKTPLIDYAEKLTTAYRWVRLLLTPFLVAAWVWYTSRSFPRLNTSLGQAKIQALGILGITGMLVGMASATREAGPFAGVIVAVYLAWRLRKQSISIIILFGLIAFTTMYASWPRLWGDPFSWLMTRLTTVTRFDEHFVLYQGIHHSSLELPWHYLPNLMWRQHTEPWLILVPVGIYSILRRFRGISQDKLFEYSLLSAWAGLPILSVIWLGTPIYSNFRHVFFAIPPLFILAGFGIQWIFDQLGHWAGRIALVTLIFLPGLLADIKLHPYQYIYYNQLSGGVAAAEGRFELDYWCTSYRRAMDFVNEVAPQDARLAVSGPLAPAAAFARRDIEIVPDGANLDHGDLALACDNRIDHPDFYPSLDIIHRVEVQGATLSVVKR